MRSSMFATRSSRLRSRARTCRAFVTAVVAVALVAGLALHLNVLRHSGAEAVTEHVPNAFRASTDVVEMVAPLTDDPAPAPRADPAPNTSVIAIDDGDEEPVSTSPLALPMCGRTLTVKLTSASGFGSQTTWLLNPAIYSSLHGRALLIDDTDWNYGTFGDYFQYNVSRGLVTDTSTHLYATSELEWNLPIMGATDCPIQLFYNDSQCAKPVLVMRQLHRFCNCADDERADHVLVTDAQWVPMGDAIEALNQHPPDTLPAPYTDYNYLFVQKRRWLSRLYQLQPALAAQLTSMMREWNIRPKLLPRSMTGAQWQSASRFLSMHVRRGDKIKESAYQPYERYIAAAEAFIAAADPATLSSWQQSRESFQADSASECATATLAFPYPQPVVVLVTDDPHTHTDLPLLRPCWRWLRFNPPSPLLPPTPPVPFHSAPMTEATVVADVIEAGHDERRFNAQSAEAKRASTNSLLLSLSLLSNGELSVVTMSSHIGKLVCLNRGYQDCFREQRVQSLDKPWVFY